MALYFDQVAAWDDLTFSALDILFIYLFIYLFMAIFIQGSLSLSAVVFREACISLFLRGRYRSAREGILC